MDSKSITKKIQELLQESETLSYIKNVYIGDRQSGISSSYPRIIIDPTTNPLVSLKRGSITDNRLVANLFIEILTADRDKAVIGVEETEEQEAVKGILEITEDVKSVLYAKFPDLEQTCLYFTYSVEEILDFTDLTGKFARVEFTAYYREKVE